MMSSSISPSESLGDLLLSVVLVDEQLYVVFKTVRMCSESSRFHFLPEFGVRDHQRRSMADHERVKNVLDDDDNEKREMKTIEPRRRSTLISIVNVKYDELNDVPLVFSLRINDFRRERTSQVQLKTNEGTPASETNRPVEVFFLHHRG